MQSLTLTLTAPAVMCTEPGCRDAWSRPELCRCSTCHGAAHGIHLRAKVAANRAETLARTGGDPFHGMPVVDDDIPVLIRRRPVAFCAPCMAPADDCTCEVAS